jgi:hypothetical protein
VTAKGEQNECSGPCRPQPALKIKSLLLLFFTKEESFFLKERSKESLLFWMVSCG